MTEASVRRLDLEAPAKINLGLRITGVRPDGYHLIESLFLPLDLADEVRVEVGAGQATDVRAVDGLVAIEVFPGDPGGGIPDLEAVPRDDRNLAVRAAQAYLAALPEGESAPPVRISLWKRIPAAAGLGGGSSDAAAVLRALAELIPKGPQGAELAALALGLGADVPFFLRPEPSLVRGIGEDIEPAPDVPVLHLLLANPGISVATADVYAFYDGLVGDRQAGSAALTMPEAGSTMPALSEPGEEVLARLLACPNELEPAAVRLCPVIARLRDRLAALGAIGVGMSGSGATVYGVFSSEVAAHEALEAGGFGRTAWARVARSRSSSAQAHRAQS